MRRCRSVWNPDLHLTIVQANVQGGERIALAGARNAFTGTGLEQRAVGGTLDKQVVGIHEPAGHPVQFNAQMLLHLTQRVYQKYLLLRKFGVHLR